jgi:hypothetical protein
MRGDNHMRKHLMRGWLLLIVATLLVSSAYAANESVDTYIIHDEPYTPYPIFVVVFAIGFVCLILSLALSGDQNQDAFAALAIIPLFVSAWMANQLDIQIAGVAGTVTDSVMRVDHHIYPSVAPYIIGAFGVIAILQLIRLITHRNKVEEPISAGRQDQGEDNQDDQD